VNGDADFVESGARIDSSFTLGQKPESAFNPSVSSEQFCCSPSCCFGIGLVVAGSASTFAAGGHMKKVICAVVAFSALAEFASADPIVLTFFQNETRFVAAAHTRLIDLE